MSAGSARAGLLTRRRGAQRWSTGCTASRRRSARARIAWDPELEDVHLNLEMALARAHRAGGRQAAHRALPQRPGGHGPAAVAAAPDRRAGRARCSTSSGRWCGLARAHADGRDARPHPRPAGPAGAVRAPPAGLRRDGRARPGPVRGRRAGARTSRRWARAPSRGPASRSTARRWPRSWASRASPATPSMPWATGTSWSRRWPPPRSAMVHLSRLAEEVVWWPNPRFGFLRPSDAFSHRVVDDAQQAQPGPRGAGARPHGRCHRAQLTGALALLKGLPASYQRDLQEDKPALFGGAPRRSRRRCA